MSEDRRATSATKLNEAIVLTAALLAFTLVLLASTFGLRASSATVPRLVGIPLVVLLCYRLFREMTAPMPDRSVDPDDRSRRRPDETRAILWLLALPAVSTLLGFVAGPALYVFAWARYRAGERTAAAIVAATSTAAAIFILFVWLLGSPLSGGLLGSLL